MLTVAAAALTGGCEDEPKKKKEVVVEPQPAKEVAPSGPVEKLDAPDAVIVYGGVEKASDMAGHLSELLLGSPTQGATQLEDAIGATALRMGLKDAKALDPSKPMRFAIVDPKKNDQPFLIAVGIKSRDEFAKSLPEKHKKDDGGNAFSYTTPSMKAVFVNYVDDWAVFTGQKDVFTANKAFAVKLIGATVKSDAGIVVDVGHMTKLYGAEMTQAIADAKKMTAKQGGALPMSGGADKMFDWLESVAKDLDKVIVTTAASKASGRLQFDLVPKAGSELEKTFKTLGPRKLEPMLGRLPADAPAALVASFDPDTATDLMRSMTAWSMQLALGQGNSDKDYSEALDGYWKGSNGEMALVAHKFEDKLRLSMLGGVRDAELVRKSMGTLRGMYGEEGFKKLYEQMSLKLKFKKDAYKVGKVSVDSVKVELIEKKDANKGDPNAALQDAMGAGAGLFAELMSHDFAVADDKLISVYGAEGKKVMEAWLEGEITGGLDKASGVQAALKGAAPGAFFLVWGSPLAVAQAMQEPGADAPAPTTGVAISMGSTDNVVHLVLDVPGEQAKALVEMVGGLGGGL